jgi:hypothetical protein
MKYQVLKYFTRKKYMIYDRNILRNTINEIITQCDILFFEVCNYISLFIANSLIYIFKTILNMPSHFFSTYQKVGLRIVRYCIQFVNKSSLISIIRPFLLEYLQVATEYLEDITDYSPFQYKSAIKRLCIALDNCGYLSSPQWIEDMTLHDIRVFIHTFESYWMQNTLLTLKVKREIHPDWKVHTICLPEMLYLTSESYRGYFTELQKGNRLLAYKRLSRSLILFINRAQTKYAKGIACMLIIKALAIANPFVAHAYPWLGAITG